MVEIENNEECLILIVTTFFLNYILDHTVFYMLFEVLLVQV